MARATRFHADARGGATWRVGAGVLMAHGLVGPGKIVGAVTQ